MRSIEVRFSRTTDGVLAVSYSIAADLSRVRMPPARTPRIAHGLWQHTCCECFIALPGKPGYHEFNFAPSGEWAAYAFAKYREGAALEDEVLNPLIVVHRSDNRLELEASIPLGCLSAAHARASLLLALSAVIEGEAGALSYWALRHPAGPPDFHHRDAFTLMMDGVE